MDPESFSLERLDHSGLRILVSWAQEEGWNPGPHDADAFWAADPEGYYGYFHKGQLIAGGSLVSYDGLFGFMGFFIVRPEYRSQGIGRRLWHQRRDTLLKRLKPGAPIGMDGVVAMQDFYRKGGFEIAFRDIRHERLGEHFPDNPWISAIEKADHASVLAYDRECFGFPRERFMDAWLALPGLRSFKYVRENALRGYALLRQASVGYKICPLFADDPQVAEALYCACLTAAAGHPVFLDIPASNPGALALVNKFGTQSQFECARMYYGKPPAMAAHKVFGITTFELG